jgi:hypothetical protein
VLVALAVMIGGPRFEHGSLLESTFLFICFVLGYIHWSIAVGFTILAVEACSSLLQMLSNFWRPAQKSCRRLLIAPPICFSRPLLSPLANFNKTYGTPAQPLPL